MNKKFRCGRLLLTKDGTIKKLDLKEGGGTRWCAWNFKDMDFHNVHYRLRSIYHLCSREHKTSLYDFQLRRLYFNRYRTLHQYMQQHGLNSNSTVIYLCSHEDNDNDASRGVSIEQNNTSVVTRPTSSALSLSTYTQAATNSFTTSNEQNPLINNQSNTNQQQTYSYSSKYSFKNTGDCLIKNGRQLMNQNVLNAILIQLYEYICVIYGYICSTIDPLDELIQQSDEYFESMSQSERTLYTNNLISITQICEYTKTLLDVNKNTFCHIQLYTTIADSLYRFFDKLTVLRNQWMENVERKKLSTTLLTSSADTRLSNQPSFTNQQQAIALPSSDVFKPLCPFEEQANKIKIENFDLSDPVCPFQEQAAEVKTENLGLFDPVLSCLNNVLSFLFPEHLSSFREQVMLALSQIETERSNINLTDERSICNTKRVLLSIKKQVEQIFQKHRVNHFKCEFNQQVYAGCCSTLVAIEGLFTALYGYQNQIKSFNQQQPLAVSNKRKLQTLDGDDDGDQRSVISLSSNDDKSISKTCSKSILKDKLRGSK